MRLFKATARISISPSTALGLSARQIADRAHRVVKRAPIDDVRTLVEARETIDFKAGETLVLDEPLPRYLAASLVPIDVDQELPPPKKPVAKKPDAAKA